MKFALRTMPIAVVAMTVLLQGCSTIKSQFRVDEAMGFGNSKQEIGSCESDDNGGNIGSLRPINLACFRFPGAAETEKPAYELALECARAPRAGQAGTVEEKNCQAARNQLQALMVLRSNAICEQHKSDIVAQAALTNSTLGVGGALTSGLGAVMSGIAAKANLAATSAFLTGSQALLNQEFYQKQFAGTIINAINTSRNAKKVEMEQRRSQLSSAYTVDDALLDAQEYHYRCSFYSGVSQITKAVERQDQTSRAKLTERIEALRVEADKTEKSTALLDADKVRMRSGLAKQIEDLQAIIKTTID